MSDEQTQAFNSIEHERIVKFAAGQEVPDIPATSHSAQEESQLAKALNGLSLDSLPDARLVIAHPKWTGIKGPTIVPIQHTNSDDWLVCGVVQPTDDVRLELGLSYYDPPSARVEQLRRPKKLQCEIYYDPTTDNCVIYSSTLNRISLKGAQPATAFPVQRSLMYGEAEVVEPGIWSIFVKAGSFSDISEIHVADLMLLKRQFTITLQMAKVPSKRKYINNDPNPAKRQRLHLETTATHSACSTEMSMSSTGLSAQSCSTSQLYLLDLKEGDAAVIYSTQSRSSRQNSLSHSAQNSYQLHRLKHIATTPSAQVFILRHSSLSDNIAAKVLSYKDQPTKPSRLIQSAKNWLREKKILETLKHSNIMALHAFDGRLLTLYLECLPDSLNRIDISCLGPAETKTILRNMVSALTYLKNKKVMHHDIKPSNIAYSPLRGAVLLDFGLAGDEKSTGGTPWYIPPEYRRTGTRGAAGDLWALGVVMLYVLQKTQLPEKACKPWAIRDVTDRQSQASHSMMEWLKVVSIARMKLDSTDIVERWTYDMLEPNPIERVRVEDITVADSN